MTLDVSYTVDCPSYDALFESCLKAVESISLEPFLETEISVVIVSPREIQRLNAEYRDKDAITDVLSFHNWESLLDIFPGYLRGEIFICFEKAQEQADELGHSLSEELATLCIHGLLHLQGHDHIEETDYVLMKSKEAQAMEILKHQKLF